MRSRIFGGSADCDDVVDSPLASGRHCQLTQTAEGFVLNDLGSTNGTFVNGVRLAGSTRLSTGDSITLGRTVPFPWPPELTRSIGIGRLDDNDIVVDDPRVSGHHARLLVSPVSQALIDDIGSSNGTFLNSADRRVTGPTPITESDTLYFGTLAVPAARLLSSLANAEKPSPLQSPSTSIAETRPGQIASRGLADSHENGRYLVWISQAVILAVAIVLAVHRPSGAAGAEANPLGVAATAFGLTLAALWLGCSLAILEAVAGHSGVRDGKRFFGLAAICAAACAGVLTIVYWGSGLNGPWPAMWGMLTTSSLVGLCSGLVISIVVRNWAAAASVLFLGFVVMIALGGWLRPLPAMTLPLRLVAGAMPSRWTFEGLLLLETDQQSATARSEDEGPAPNHDLAEQFFPAESERMGPTADAFALTSMLIGLAAVAVFTSTLPRIGRCTL